VFCFDKPSAGFIWEGLLTVEGMGKFGLVCDFDQEGNGYFISLDIINGHVEIRSWGFNPLNNRNNFIFNDIQGSLFTITGHNSIRFSLIRYGNYFELSINGVVTLSLMDYTFAGNGLGFYTASSVISLQQSLIHTLPDPEGEYASQEEAQKISD
jgi:beta-fructofuranosidase